MENKVIPYGRQNITQEDIDIVVEALKSDYLPATTTKLRASFLRAT